jgi:sugar transferase (PEP-CTERM/EpsH1 system associated)
MNILFICHRIPFPPNRGGKIRPFNMIRHLAQSHSVVVATLAHSTQELAEGLAGLEDYGTELIAEVVPKSIRWRQCCTALLTRTPSSTAYFWSSRLQQRIQQSAGRTAFDVVWVHCAFVARYAFSLHGRFWVLDYGDLDSGKWLDYSRHRKFPLGAGYALEARKLRAYETKLATCFDHCTVTSQGELEEFHSLCVPVSCTVIPNGVDLDYFQQFPEAKRSSPVIVFLGRMDYYPNVDGILNFAGEIFPLIQKQVPGVQLRIIGSNPVRQVRALEKSPSITVTGHVPDVRPHLADAAVSVVPLRLGRGTQNKMLEAMAMAVPVVASPAAAKGVQAVAERDFLLGRTPQEFASQTVRLLQDPAFQRSLASAGRRQIETAHSWAVSMKIVDQIIAQGYEQFRQRPSVRAPL